MNQHQRRFEEGIRRCSAALYELAETFGQAAAKMAPIVRAALEELVRRRCRPGGGNTRDRRRRRRAAWREAIDVHRTCEALRSREVAGYDDSEAW